MAEVLLICRFVARTGMEFQLRALLQGMLVRRARIILEPGRRPSIISLAQIFGGQCASSRML